MRLIVGGAYQNKLEYAQKTYGPLPVREGADCPLEAAEPAALLHGLHHLIRRMVEEKKPVEQLLRGHIGPDTVVVCDEVGCGVVPMDRLERQWREETGRACCRLAEQARTVDRVVCGLPQRIKEEP
ncbi:MAG: bifunctional adenosylcobinamide kinase/adenosylcobinamide-phosphate guanylyltransferase [Eubacteriales bacterium]|jgi:adenosylcobinamide kinase/adenosylcobinamide-phosphate guanylyltransferase